MTKILVTLGVFDDYDKVPTILFGTIHPNTEQDTLVLLEEMVTQLILAARDEYGSTFPASACFWHCSTKEVEQ